ncbi:MAG: glycosyltransferase, partial [Chloroflexota bacterium]
MSARRSILICTYGSAGDLLPYLAVGHELRRRGWHVTVGAPAVHAARIRGLGLGAAPIRPDKAVNEPDPDLWDRIRSGRASPGALFSEMFLPSLRASFEDTLAAAGGVDVILSHTLAFAAPIVAQRLGVAWISGVVSPIAYFSRSDPPVVGPGWSGPALRAFGGSGARIAAAAKDGVLRAWSGEWRAIRRECGLDDRGDPVSAQHSPLRALALFSPLLAAPQPDWPASALVTGFPFVDDPTAAGMEPDLGAFLDAGEPPLVVTLGTTAVNEAGGFYDAAAAAAGMLGLRAVLRVGSRPGHLPAAAARRAAHT